MEKVTVYGFTAYTSQELRDRLKSIISRYGGELKNILFNLVDNKLVVPIILHKNVLQQFLNKIRKNKLYQILGTFDGDTMYIITPEKVLLKKVYYTVVHECIHYVSRKYVQQFFNINKRTIFLFYETFFKLYLQSDRYDKFLFSKFIARLLIHHNTKIISVSTYNLIELAFEKYTKLKTKDFYEKMEILTDFIFDQLNDKNIYIDSYREIYLTLEKTYKILFKKTDPDTGLGQELYSPSEIIAVLSTINQNHPDILKTLELLKK
jgi:hypothetical protein